MASKRKLETVFDEDLGVSRVRKCERKLIYVVFLVVCNPLLRKINEKLSLNFSTCIDVRKEMLVELDVCG